jgi:5-methylcytosine-specific restriction protein A
MRKGYVFPASEVDHIIDKADGGTDDDSNLEAICNPCHTAKTQDSAARARAKG